MHAPFLCIKTGCVQYLIVRRKAAIEPQNEYTYTDTAGYAQVIENPSNQTNMQIFISDDKSKAQSTRKASL